MLSARPGLTIALFFVAALVQPCFCQPLQDPELDAVAQYERHLRFLDNASPDEMLGLRPRRRTLALAHAAPPGIDQADRDVREAVAASIEGKQGSFEDLTRQQMASKAAQGDLQGSVNEAVRHMKDGAALKHAIVKKEVNLRIASKNLRKLQREAGRLAETRDNLVSSLHLMLDKKIAHSQEILQKKETTLFHEEEANKEWAAKAEELKAVSVELINEKHSSKDSLLEAEAEVARAKEREAKARRKYESDSQAVADKVQSFHYADTRRKAQIGHLQLTREAARSAQESMKQLTNALAVETRKVEGSVDYRKTQLEGQIHQTQLAIQKHVQELEDMKRAYGQWRSDQRQRTVNIAQKRLANEKASEKLATRRKALREAAKKKAAHITENGGDWDLWGTASTIHDDDTNELDLHKLDS